MFHVVPWMVVWSSWENFCSRASGMCTLLSTLYFYKAFSKWFSVNITIPSFQGGSVVGEGAAGIPEGHWISCL